jgi:hydroxymethylpyrimidine kinase/phosphomethylpyrimidine kinase
MPGWCANSWKQSWRTCLPRAAEAFSFPLVVDPVLLSTHGRPLLPEDALPAMRELMRYAALITPNLPELEAIAGVAINEDNDLRRAVSWMFEMGARAILIKGGHRTGPPTDVFFDRGLWEDFPAERIETRHTHGTGCTYSAAITAALAQGEPLRSAVARAKRFVHEAIRTSPGLGRGSGPLNHFADSSRGDSE